ncbi:hypothetical protein GCM10010245_88500 [Streptomyces spectabilis]|nr:hypothetical protein GCM10010245_88500 [Streptomyces spectabilis]
MSRIFGSDPEAGPKCRHTVAAKVDAGYPDNADLTIDQATGKMVLSPPP